MIITFFIVYNSIIYFGATVHYISMVQLQFYGTIDLGHAMVHLHANVILLSFEMVLNDHSH